MDPLVQKVLGDPSKYPRELISHLSKVISGNKLFQIDWPQLPGPRISASASGSSPKSPQLNDLWFLTDTNQVKRWTGGLWAVQADQGIEIGYDQITASVNITGLTSGTATTIIAAAAHTFDGTPVMLEFFCPQIITPSVAGNSVGIGLYESGSLISFLATVLTPAAANMRAPVCARQRFTPSAGAHTYTIAAFVTSTTGTPQAIAGTGTGGTQAPAFLRFTRV